MNENKYKDWSPIRNMLKEKFGHLSIDGDSENQSIPSNNYWSKFQQITGKNKEQMQTELRNF